MDILVHLLFDAELSTAP